MKSVSEKVYPWGTVKEEGDVEKARGGKECAEIGNREENEDQTQRGKKTHTGQEDRVPPGATFHGPTTERKGESRAGKGVFGQAGS